MDKVTLENFVDYDGVDGQYFVSVRDKSCVSKLLSTHTNFITVNSE